MPARTAEGDLIEVFDQTGPLPAGWGPDGPEPALTVAAPPQPTPARQPTVAPSPLPASEPPTAKVAPAALQRAVALGATAPGAVAPRATAPPVFAPAAEPRRGGRGIRGRRLAVVAGVAAAVVLAGAVLAYATGRPDDGSGDRSPTPSPPASVAPSTGQPTRQPLPGVSAGGSCGWQDVGTQERLTDGRSVRCEYQPADGTYRWTPVS